MAYCRWGAESDVYVYDSSSGYFLCCCDFDGCEAKSRSEMINHLRWHRQQGHKVPDRAIDLLFAEIATDGDEWKPDEPFPCIGGCGVMLSFHVDGRNMCEPCWEDRTK